MSQNPLHTLCLRLCAKGQATFPPTLLQFLEEVQRGNGCNGQRAVGDERVYLVYHAPGRLCVWQAFREWDWNVSPPPSGEDKKRKTAAVDTSSSFCDDIIRLRKRTQTHSQTHSQALGRQVDGYMCTNTTSTQQLIHTYLGVCHGRCGTATRPVRRMTAETPLGLHSIAGGVDACVTNCDDVFRCTRSVADRNIRLCAQTRRPSRRGGTLVPPKPAPRPEPHEGSTS